MANLGAVPIRVPLARQRPAGLPPPPMKLWSNPAPWLVSQPGGSRHTATRYSLRCETGGGNDGRGGSNGGRGGGGGRGESDDEDGEDDGCWTGRQQLGVAAVAFPKIDLANSLNIPDPGRSKMKRWADKNAPWLCTKIAVALLLWLPLLLPWYNAKFTGGVIPIGAVLMATGQAFPAMQPATSNAAAVLGSFGLMKGVEVLSSFVGITSLGLAAVPLLACVAVYTLSALLTATRFGVLDGISHKHTATAAGGAVAGVALTLAIGGPLILPGPGLALAGVASYWAYQCSTNLDRAQKRR